MADAKSNTETEILSALNGALGSQNGGLLANLFHQNTVVIGLNVPQKTMTTTWVAANPTIAPLMEAQGYSIVIG